MLPGNHRLRAACGCVPCRRVSDDGGRCESARDLRFQLARAYQQAGRKEEAAREFAEVQRLKDEGVERERKGAVKP